MKIGLDKFCDLLSKINMDFTDYILEDWEAEEKELSAELARLTEEVENIPEDYNSVCGEGTSLRLIDGKSYCVD